MTSAIRDDSEDRRQSSHRRWRRAQVPLVLGGVILVHFVLFLLWVRQDHLTLGVVSDDWAHIAGFHQLLASIDIGGLPAALQYLTEINSHYSYLAHYPIALPAFLIGHTNDTGRAANVLYFAMLLISVYGLGRACHGKQAGLLSAVLVSLMPAVHRGWRTIGLDFPILCMTPMAVLCLLRTDGFRRLRASALFGFAVGVGALLKAHLLLFVFWPAAYILAIRLWEDWRAGDRREVKRRLINAGASLLILAATTSIWWAKRLDYFSHLFLSHVTGEGMYLHEGDISVWGGISFYVTSFPQLVSGCLALALFALVPVFFKSSRHRWTILVWLVVPFLLHVFFLKLRNVRYIDPLAPAVALVIGVGLSSLGPRLRAWATLATCVLTGALFILAAYTHVMPRSIADLAYPSMAPHAPYSVKNAPHAGPEERLSRWLEQRHPRGQKTLLFHGLHFEQDIALLTQMRLSRLRLSHHAFVRSKHYPPPPDWTRYVLEVRRIGDPANRDVSRLRVVYSDSFDFVERFDHRTVQLRLWLRRLDPGDRWPI